MAVDVDSNIQDRDPAAAHNLCVALVGNINAAMAIIHLGG